MPFSLPPTQTRRTSTIIFITIRPRWTAPGNSGTASALAVRCGGSLTAFALKMICQKQNITEYDQFSAKAENAVSRFHALTEQLRRTEADLSATSELMGAVVRYAKTRPVFDGYKAAKYS